MFGSPRYLIVLAVGFVLGLLASNLSIISLAFAFTRHSECVWTENSPQYLVTFGQKCPHCGEKQPDRCFIMGQIKGTRDLDGAVFYTFLVDEFYDKKIPHDLAANPNRTWDHWNQVSPTVNFWDEAKFNTWCKTGKNPTEDLEKK
ncbi:MAG TPA: hypothetical protein VFE46_13750 [Pirellulales bacterium]|jgi:hypothetical protein|nr:hypothetical protein [Pirellulales bacterium]